MNLLYDRIMELVESLPEGYSKVFKLAVLEGLPHKEIGELLHIGSIWSSSHNCLGQSLLLKKMINVSIGHFIAAVISLSCYITVCINPRRLPGKRLKI